MGCPSLRLLFSFHLPLQSPSSFFLKLGEKPIWECLNQGIINCLSAGYLNKKVDIKSKLRRIGCPLVVLLLSAEKAYPLKFFFSIARDCWLPVGLLSICWLDPREYVILRRVGLSGFDRAICLCLLSVWSFSSFTDKWSNFCRLLYSIEGLQDKFRTFFYLGRVSPQFHCLTL